MVVRCSDQKGVPIARTHQFQNGDSPLSFPSWLSDRELCWAAVHQRALQTAASRRTGFVLDPSSHCPLQDRYEAGKWAAGHGMPRHTREVLDQASLLLRCLHAHLYTFVMERCRGELPRSARAEDECVSEHWVRPYGAKLLDAFNEMNVNISTADVVDTTTVLASWLWKKVSTHAQKRFLTPPPGEKRCKSELGWPDFFLTYDEFWEVIWNTMGDYFVARYYIGVREPGSPVIKRESHDGDFAAPCVIARWRF